MIFGDPCWLNLNVHLTLNWTRLASKLAIITYKNVLHLLKNICNSDRIRSVRFS